MREDILWELGHSIIDYGKCHDLQTGMPIKPLVVTYLEGLKTRAGNSTPPKTGSVIQGQKIQAFQIRRERINSFPHLCIHWIGWYWSVLAKMCLLCSNVSLFCKEPKVTWKSSFDNSSWIALNPIKLMNINELSHYASCTFLNVLNFKPVFCVCV